MSYEITVTVPEMSNLVEMLKWAEDQGWKHIVEWRWFKMGMKQHTGLAYKFQFDNPKHAEWFALRWI